jgi:hypothetical protein
MTWKATDARPNRLLLLICARAGNFFGAAGGHRGVAGSVLEGDVRRYHGCVASGRVRTRMNAAAAAAAEAAAAAALG